MQANVLKLACIWEARSFEMSQQKVSSAQVQLTMTLLKPIPTGLQQRQENLVWLMLANIQSRPTFHTHSVHGYDLRTLTAMIKPQSDFPEIPARLTIS